MFVFKRFCLIVSCTLITCSMGLSQPANPPVPPLNREREEVADKDVPKSSEVNAVNRLAQSREPDNVIANDAERAVVDKVFKYYIYRLSWEEVQRERDPAKVGTISTIMNELIGTVENSPKLLPPPFSGNTIDQDTIQTRQRQLGNVQQFTPIMVKYCKAVLQNKQPIARINAARVLAKLAEWGQEAVVDELTNIINHPDEHNAVRNWAFQGLAEIYALNGTSDPRGKGLFQSKEGQTRFTNSLTAVYQWLDKSCKMTAAQLQNMQPEEQDALRYVRRNAARALGASRRPLINDVPATKTQVGPIAELLNKIVAGDGSITPAPTLRERLDTTLALCQLRGDTSPSYNADYTAYQIANCLTALGSQANTDKDNPNNSMFKWQYEAQRLRVAIDTFAAQRTAGPTTAYLVSFKQKALALLEFFDDFNKNTDAVKSMNDWVRENSPPSGKVYK